jgi:broad specificity polyphosphatase/5'/3'-nucleotidase SurE
MAVQKYGKTSQLVSMTRKTSNEFVESVLVQSAVEPLVATVEQTTYDMDGVATVATVANPLIVTDDEERASAQAVVDGTPTDVVAFVS